MGFHLLLLTKLHHEYSHWILLLCLHNVSKKLHSLEWLSQLISSHATTNRAQSFRSRQNFGYSQTTLLARFSPHSLFCVILDSEKKHSLEFNSVSNKVYTDFCVFTSVSKTVKMILPHQDSNPRTWSYKTRHLHNGAMRSWLANRYLDTSIIHEIEFCAFFLPSNTHL